MLGNKKLCKEIFSKNGKKTPKEVVKGGRCYKIVFLPPHREYPIQGSLESYSDRWITEWQSGSLTLSRNHRKG